MGQGRRLWTSSASSFSHCTYSVPLYPPWLSTPPSLSHYPPPTTGQFVRPAWLPPPLLLRYLAPFLHFNGRYWLENFHDPFAVPQKSPLPIPATFNLITGFLQPFRGGQTRQDNGRPSGFTNTLLAVIRLAGGAASTLRWHQVPPAPAGRDKKKTPKKPDVGSVRCPLGSNCSNSVWSCVWLTLKVQSACWLYLSDLQRECWRFRTKNKTVNSDL